MKMKNSIIGLSLLTVLVLSSGCITKNMEVEPEIKLKKYEEKQDSSQNRKLPKVTFGKASYYSSNFNGKKTASGEVYNMYAKTAAHRTLPFNTMVRVTDMETHKSDIVRINDRGPFVGDRVIDLSYASARKLGLIDKGVANVKLEIVGYNGKVDSHMALPVSTQACVGGKCKANIFDNEEEESTPKKKKEVPLFASVRSRRVSTISQPSQPQIESVYDNTYVASSYKKDNLVSHRTIRPYSYASGNTSIQVGAFRRYAGAKIYAKRYSLLSSRYKTIIKKDILDGKPIYRVRIKGFKNRREAKKFMSRYSLSGAFLVRR